MEGDNRSWLDDVAVIATYTTQQIRLSRSIKPPCDNKHEARALQGGGTKAGSCKSCFIHIQSPPAHVPRRYCLKTLSTAITVIFACSSGTDMNALWHRHEKKNLLNYSDVMNTRLYHTFVSLYLIIRSIMDREEHIFKAISRKSQIDTTWQTGAKQICYHFLVNDHLLGTWYETMIHQPTWGLHASIP